MKFTELQKSVATGLSMPRALKERIDKDRGDILRSKFILRILERIYGNEQESSPAITNHPSTDKSMTAVKRYKHDDKKKQDRKVVESVQVGTGG